MIDVVIPLKIGASTWDDNELRYSLRSLHKHLGGIRHVVIIAESLPTWIRGVHHIQFGDHNPVPSINTARKLQAACLDPEVTENFLLSNDDFFLNQYFDANTFPYFHRGDLLANIKKLGNSEYAQCRERTAQVLRNHDLTIRSFEVHGPMRFNKAMFLKAVDLFDFDQGLLPRSIYGNLYNMRSEYHADYVIRLPLNLPGPIDKARFFFVRHGTISLGVEMLLKRHFPTKSKWEQ